MKLVTDLCDPKVALNDELCTLTLCYSLNIEKCFLEVWASCWWHQGEGKSPVVLQEHRTKRPWFIQGLVRISHQGGHISLLPNSLWPYGPQHARPPCPSPTPRVYSNSCPSSQWCHPTISSSVIPFSSRLQSFPASGSFQISQFFKSGSQRTGASASASVLPMNI